MRFARTALIYAGTSALASGIPILLMPLLTRVLPPEDYGRIALFLLGMNFLTVMTGVGLNGAMSVKYFREDIDFPRYAGTCIWIVAGLSVVYLLAAPLYLGPLSNVMEIGSSVLLLMVLAASANAVILIRLAIWQVKYQAGYFGGLRITQASLDVGFSLLLVLVLYWGWQGRVFGASIAFLGAGTLCLISLARDGLLVARPDRAYLRDALMFGIPLMPHLVAGLLLTLADRFLVANLLSVEAAGVYMVAVQIGLALNLIVVSVNQTFAPWLMRQLSAEDAIRDMRIVRVTYLYMAALLVTALVLGQLARIALGLLAGEAYQDAAVVIPLITLGIAASGGYYMVTNYIFYAGKTALLSVLTTVVGTASVGMSYLLIARFGILGAGMGVALAQTVMFLGTWGLAQYCRPMPWRAALRRG
tara:strand:+ start:5151 stop:6401 length:1251 start_codon:yes stop_codon:yes gene_type:complete